MAAIVKRLQKELMIFQSIGTNISRFEYDRPGEHSPELVVVDSD